MQAWVPKYLTTSNLEHRGSRYLGLGTQAGADDDHSWAISSKPKEKHHIKQSLFGATRNDTATYPTCYVQSAPLTTRLCESSAAMGSGVRDYNSECSNQIEPSKPNNPAQPAGKVSPGNRFLFLDVTCVTLCGGGWELSFHTSRLHTPHPPPYPTLSANT